MSVILFPHELLMVPKATGRILEKNISGMPMSPILAVSFYLKHSGLWRTTNSAKQDQRPLKRNRMEAMRASIPYKHLVTDQHGKLLHPKPAIYDQQTAIVVEPTRQHHPPPTASNSVSLTAWQFMRNIGLASQ